MYLKMVKDLTINDVEKMRHPQMLGEEADTLIWMMRRMAEGEGFSEEEFRTKTLEELTNL
jgi:hypothetical protein